MAVSSPPPKAVPWMAAITGLPDCSTAFKILLKPGPRRVWPEVILPNSLMSAPAINVRPPPISTIAFTLSSLSNASTPARIPSGTPGLSALTGGLLTVRIPISPDLLDCTRSLIGALILSGGTGFWPLQMSLRFCVCNPKEHVKHNADHVAEKHPGDQPRRQCPHQFDPETVADGKTEQYAHQGEREADYDSFAHAAILSNLSGSNPAFRESPDTANTVQFSLRSPWDFGSN